MSDNVPIKDASGTSVPIASDEVTNRNGNTVTAEQTQRVKPVWGLDGISNDADPTQPFPVRSYTVTTSSSKTLTTTESAVAADDLHLIATAPASTAANAIAIPDGMKTAFFQWSGNSNNLAFEVSMDSTTGLDGKWTLLTVLLASPFTGADRYFTTCGYAEGIARAPVGGYGWVRVRALGGGSISVPTKIQLTATDHNIANTQLRGLARQDQQLGSVNFYDFVNFLTFKGASTNMGAGDVTLPTQVLGITPGSATGTIAAINQNVQLTLNGASTVSIQVVGSYTQALTPQVSNDGTNWIGYGSSIASIYVQSTNSFNVQTIAASSPGLYKVDVSGYKYFRLITLASGTGTATITLNATHAVGLNALQAPLPLGTNQIGNVALAAGSQSIGTLGASTNTIGAVALVARATTGGASISAVEAAASTNAAVIKASAGNVIDWQLTNNAAYAVFIKFYNKASAPTVGTDTPLFKIQIPAGGIATMPPGVGKFFSTGIAIAITKLLATSDTTAVAAGDVVGQISYA